MFDKFGNFNGADEINELARNLRKEKDLDSIRALAKENGIDEEIAEAFIDGETIILCDHMAAAIGKIEIECMELKPVEIMADWVEYLKARCFESEEIAKAVRKNNKNLVGCIGALLQWSFNNQKTVSEEIIKAAGLKVAYKIGLGIPGMGRSKQIITDYYLGGK